MIEQTELLPCPFCGHKNTTIVEGSTFRWRKAECAECGACGPDVRVQTMGEGTKEEWEADVVTRCTEAWNTRAALRPVEPVAWIVEMPDGAGEVDRWAVCLALCDVAGAGK